MARRRVRLVILCEDRQQEVFARKFFLSRGFHHRELEFKTAPGGKGSAEQFVREQYPLEVKTYRRKSTYLSSILLAVIIDADVYTVEQRINQLEITSEQQRLPHEKIAIFVPKRNIETWIHYLMGESVDEESVYPKMGRESDCKPYVEKLVENICPTGLPNGAPPSLYLACDELERIL
jgi:hypothetical protein